MSARPDPLDPIDAALLAEVVRLLRKIRTNGMAIEIKAKGHAAWSLALVRRERMDVDSPEGHGRAVALSEARQ